MIFLARPLAAMHRCTALLGALSAPVLVALSLAAPLVALGPHPAMAQGDPILRPPGSVPRPPANGGLNIFGGWTLFAPNKPPPAQAPAPPKQPPPEPEGTIYSSANEATQGKKQPPTAFVLVMGDALAGQLARGLADSYVTEKNSPAVITSVEEDSGFLPDPPLGIDWMTRLPEAVKAARANVAILALGSNDIRPIKDGDQTVEPFTDRWNELYGRRLDELLAALRTQTPRVILVGVAPVQSTATMADYARLNDLLRAHAARAGVPFANVWDGFVDEDGKYIAFGAAVDGQRRRLRFNDGVRFTRAGARKLAFFTQKDLARLLAEPATPEAAPPTDGTRAPLSLTDGPRGANALAGAAALPTLARPGTGAAAIPAALPLTDPVRVLTEGAPLAAVPGRADDHSWPPRPVSAPAAAPPQSTGLPPAQ